MQINNTNERFDGSQHQAAILVEWAEELPTKKIGCTRALKQVIKPNAFLAPKFTYTGLIEATKDLPPKKND